MARLKAAKGKAKTTPNMPRAGWPCVALVLLAMVATMALIYAVLKSS